MSQFFTGKALLEHRDELDMTQEFFDLIDKDGSNTIVESTIRNQEYHCLCLFKFVDSTEPFEALIVFPKDIYDKIVFDIELSSFKDIKGVN